MINNVSLKSFRSYADDSFEFSPSVNIIVGPNASGKTNLLEAILMICSGRSYRARDNELIMFKKQWARVDAELVGGIRSLKLVRETASNTAVKTLIINNEVIRRITSNKKIPVVLFEPNHLQLLNEGPEARREYLDDLLEQLWPAFSPIRTQYRRTLAQRNRLLKQPAGDIQNQLFVWNIRMSELGGQVAKYRRDLIDQINKALPALYKTLSGSKTKAQISYESKLPLGQYSSALLHKLESSLDRDMARGFTAYGPHRDDMNITLNGHTTYESASRGEIRTLLLGLKIIELRLLEEKYNTKPLLLLDDVFSELDGARRQALTAAIKGYQTFITTTDADIITKHFSEASNIILIGS